MRAIVGLVLVVLAAAAPARADVSYRLIHGRSADGRLGAGSKYADVFVFQDDFESGSLTDPQSGYGSSRIGCVTFVNGSTRKESCGSLTLAIDETMSKATMTGALPQAGGGTITINMVVTADVVGVPYVGVPIAPTNPSVPRFCLPIVGQSPCQYLGTGFGRPGTTWGSVKSSTLGTVTAAAGGTIWRGEFAAFHDD